MKVKKFNGKQYQLDSFYRHKGESSKIDKRRKELIRKGYSVRTSSNPPYYDKILIWKRKVK